MFCEKPPEVAVFFDGIKKGFEDWKLSSKKTNWPINETKFSGKKNGAFGNLNSRGTHFGIRKLRFDPISLREFLGVKKKSHSHPWKSSAI